MNTLRLRFLIILALGPVVIGSAGCGGTSDEADAVDASGPRGEKLSIITTTGMIADIVREVAGDRAQVTALMGPEIDPHLYRPMRDDMSKLLGADIVFYNGLNLEGKMADSFVQIARSGKPVYAVTELLDESFLLMPDGFEGYADPHVWMDPRAWADAVRVVTDALAAHDSAHAADYRQRGDAFRDRLVALDAWARERLHTIPDPQRVLVTAHDAFGYFGRAYGLEVHGIQGISTESEAGLRAIEDLVDLLVDRSIPAVFTETSVSDRNVTALIAGARARQHTVQIGGRLFSDAMGPRGTYEGTYIGMIDHNVTTITRALGGVVDDAGMQGKLTN